MPTIASFSNVRFGDGETRKGILIEVQDTPTCFGLTEDMELFTVAMAFRGNGEPIWGTAALYPSANMSALAFVFEQTGVNYIVVGETRVYK